MFIYIHSDSFYLFLTFLNEINQIIKIGIGKENYEIIHHKLKNWTWDRVAGHKRAVCKCPEIIAREPRLWIDPKVLMSIMSEYIFSRKE